MQKKKIKKKSWTQELTHLLNLQQPTNKNVPIKEKKTSSHLKQKPVKKILPLKLHENGLRIARKRSKASSLRKSLLTSYKASHAELPTQAVCAVCGIPCASSSMEKHHVAGRRKAAFCFYILLHSDCHRRVHDNPKWAEEKGLLAKGRNSKELTIEYATELVRLMPHPPTYCIPILTKHQSL